MRGAGQNLWSTSAGEILDHDVPESILASTANGRIESNLSRVELSENTGTPNSIDTVDTYLPLLDSSGDSVVGVIGITRDVTSTLTSQIDETRSSVSLFTMLSLVVVFFVLLMFIFVADIKIFQANSQKVHSERELNDRLMIDSLELKRIGKMKDRFLSSITHELMTPLTSITAFTGILLRNRDSNLNKRNIDQLQVMKRNSEQLKTLLANLLEFSEMNETGYELSYGRFNVLHVLDELTDAFMPAIHQKNLNIELDYLEADALVEADDARVRQVISNVLTNAIKYSPEHTDIKISAWVTDLLFTITIQDNGIGISERDKQELFTLFFRVDNELTRSVPGTGLGLISSKQIIELHGGELTLQSQEGEGTKVDISLPRFRTRHSAETEGFRAA